MCCTCPPGSQRVIIYPYGKITLWCPCMKEKIPEPKSLATSEFKIFCENLQKNPITTVSFRDEFLQQNYGSNKISGSYAIETMYRNGWIPKAYYVLPHGDGWIYTLNNNSNNNIE